MIKYTTRLMPTLNGELHLGHLYNIKINETEAHQSGGKFGIIIDRQRAWNWIAGPENLKLYEDTMKKDLEWAGINIDFWTSTEEYAPKIKDLLENEFHYKPEPQPFAHDECTEVIGIDQTWYAYTEELTVEKVIIDALMGVNWCIRGWDLIPEDMFYKYFVHRFGLARVRLTYIPKLLFKNDTVSKTEGQLKIKDFREAGFSAGEILALLGNDCLQHPLDGWRVDNIKTPQPHVGSWIKIYGLKA